MDEVSDCLFALCEDLPNSAWITRIFDVFRYI